MESPRPISDVLTPPKPEKLFRYPEEVLTSTLLNTHEKLEILQSWQEDVEALLRAADENMEGNDENSEIGKLLQSIIRVKKSLDTKTPMPNKRP